MIHCSRACDESARSGHSGSVGFDSALEPTRTFDEAIIVCKASGVSLSAGESTLTGQDFEDAELLARIAEGDTEALATIYDRYQRAVYSLCDRVTRDQGAAEEITQEVFVRLWKSAASFEPGKGRVSAWLLRIAHNLALNEVRRRSSRPVIAYEADWEVESGGVADADQQRDPAMAAWLGERAVAIRAALSQLPAPQRQAIELAFFDGLTQAEIAAAVGDPLGTVKSRIRIGMQRLREVLLAAGIDEVR